MSLSFCRRVLLWSGLLIVGDVQAQRLPTTSADAVLQGLKQMENQSPIAPTVSREMGDVGGKLFGRVPAEDKVRRYYVAAELDAWDYAPENRDPVCAMPLPLQIAETSTAVKIRYVQYTDATFAKRVIPNTRLGVMGPVLRGVTGETLAVTFLNKTELPLSMHPHGVKYDKDSEGSYYQPKPGLGAAVGPGAKFTYMWLLDEQAGPLPGEPSSKCWLYHSHVHGDAEANAGLVGMIVVADPARARQDGTPKDVDREMATLFMIFNESGFDEEAAEMAAAGDPQAFSWSDLQAQLELGSRFAINGRVFGNLSGLEMNEGERVRWYLAGLGNEVDMHTAHWHGLRVVEEGRRRTDVVELLPATMKVADMMADNPGEWLFHCHVAEHMAQGMFTRVVVYPKAKAGDAGAAGPAFFAGREALESLRFAKARIQVDTAPNAAQPCEIFLRGVVTVPAAYEVAKEQLRVQVGERTAVFRVGADGKADAEGISLRILNGGRYGVVGGGLMEFTVTLSGTGWLEELQRIGLVRDGAMVKDRPLELQVEVGDFKHSATVHEFAP